MTMIDPVPTRFYNVYIQTGFGETEIVEIQAESPEAAFNKAIMEWFGAERILVAV